MANITASGSSVLVLPNASITFVGPGVELTRGGISVTTSEEITVSSYGLIFTPAERRQSKFEVVEYQDSVIVAARQGNVIVADGQQTSMVPEGQESTHKKKKGGDMPAPESSHSTSGQDFGHRRRGIGCDGSRYSDRSKQQEKKCVSASNNKKCKKDAHGNDDCEEVD